jgi:hypothetical protein
MTWESDWKKIEKKIDHVLNKGIRATLFGVSTAIIKETPADTGRARGNWQASVGSGATGEVFVTGKRSGQAKAIASVNQAASVAVGDLFFLTNNLPYIRVLEYGEYPTTFKTNVDQKGGPKITRDGYSIQAPYGMVRKNVQNFNRLLVKNIKAASN